MAVIYRITNMANDRYYIGSAESFARREWQHKYDLRKGKHKNPRLQAAWNKYGEEMFVFEVLEEVPEGEATFDRENVYLHEHVGKPECYNINTDAIGMRTGIPMSEASKRQLSKNRKGKHAGEDHYRYGQEVAPEVRAKISATQKGRPSPMKGKKMSEQGRQNVIAAIKRGEESHFYGKRPKNADDLQKAVLAVLPDRSERCFESLSKMRDELGISLATIIRACKSGNPVKFGPYAGWVLFYADSAPNEAPEIPEEFMHLPRSRSEAKKLGAKQYFTGMPCDRGHISPRATKGACIACRREDDKAKYHSRKHV